MSKFKINHFCVQPVRKEYKAPFVDSALVYGDIVGFCFKDFCTQVYLANKHNLLMSFEPEFIFCKLMALKDRFGSGKMPNALKSALDLLLLKNSKYRPWYISDSNPLCVKLFRAERIEFRPNLYRSIVNSITPNFNHPYLQLTLTLYTTVENGNYYINGNKLIDEMNYLVGRKIYQHVKIQNYFHHDTFFNQLYELGLGFIITENKKITWSYSLIMLTYWLFKNTKLKSSANLLIVALHQNANFFDQLKEAYAESDWILNYSSTKNYAPMLRQAMAELESRKKPIVPSNPEENKFQSSLRNFQHWQDTDAEMRYMQEVFAQIPDEHKDSVLWLMGMAKRCGELNESDANNSDL